MNRTSKPVHQSARSIRLLNLLSKQAANVSKSQTGDVVLLEFEGKRTVKCPVAIHAHWLSAGLAKCEANKLSITTSGKAFLSRCVSIAKDGLEANQFGAQHRSMLNRDEPGLTGPAKYVNANESPLSRLYSMKDGNGGRWISEIEYQAGEKLRRDFEFAHLAPRITQSFDQVSIARARCGAANAVANESDNVMDARTRVNNALSAIDPELAGVALDVCCYLKGLERVESERRWPRRSAKVVLKTALSALARHYFPVAKGKGRAGILRWGADGYRPTFDVNG